MQYSTVYYHHIIVQYSTVQYGEGPALGDLQGEVRAAVLLQLHADTTSAD